MGGVFTFLGPWGTMILAAVLYFGGQFAWQKGQIWWQKEKTEYCESKLADSQKSLDDLTSKVETLTKERDVAQGQANAAWKAYAKKEQEQKHDNETIANELAKLAGTYQCDLPDSVRKLWDKANTGSLEDTSGREAAPPVPTTSTPVAVRR